MFPKNAEWIWNKDASNENIYVDFFDEFNAKDNLNYTLFISAHTQYAIYLNGQYVPASQYADYEDYPVYDKIDITQYIHSEKNTLKITCYYFGQDSSATRNALPGLIYAINEDQTCIAYSGTHTLTAPNTAYTKDCPRISNQLGYSFCYDSTIPLPKPNNAVIQKKAKTLYPRPVKLLTFEDPAPAKIISQGVFADKEKLPGTKVGFQMLQAALTFRPREEISLPCDGATYYSEDGQDGIYLILDFQKEQTGLLEFDLDLEQDAKICIGTGEQLLDMRVRTQMSHCQYACTYYGHKGTNRFLHPFRRFGLKYMQIHIYAKSVCIRYAGFRPTLYPVSDIPFFKCADHLHNKIYDVCKNTLLQCMHEHYEDCPTREQALYTMDSRNQMLCGYYVFGEYEFAKSSLRLISKSIRDDNLLELCSPARVAITIPAFSAIFLTQSYEYLLYSGDKDFVKEELLPVLKRIADMFIAHIEEIGLIYEFRQQQYWNFYEWRDGLDGTNSKDEKICAAPLNAFVSAGLRDLAKICDELNDPAAQRYKEYHIQINKAFNDLFWNENQNLYASYYTKDGLWHYAQLTQALAVWANICDAFPKRKEKALCALAEDKIIPVTPSSAIFKYDALLHNADLYGRFVFNDIAQRWGEMLYQGATTFWETFNGANDFGGAGSLCHGWSAIPAYFYYAYALGIIPERPGFEIDRQNKILSGLYDCRGRIKMPDTTQITFN